MNFAIDTPNFGDFADPNLLAQLAHEAEDVGWDGFFLWDHIGANWPYPVGDPWIQLAAMATTTERIKLGTTVTPLPRRRPWQLARQVVSLDHLSVAEAARVCRDTIRQDAESWCLAYPETTDVLHFCISVRE